MDAGTALLEEILARPEDDVPRLVYADWLDEHGGPADQARAEFIRLQIALASLPPAAEQRPLLEAQERRLRKRFERQWLGPLREQVQAWGFTRGFVAHLAIDAACLLTMHDTIARTHPVVSLRLTFVRDRLLLARLANLPFLDRVSALDLSNNYLDRNAVAALLDSAYLRGLHTLGFNDNPYGYDAVSAVARSPELTGLSVLEMRRNNLTDATGMVLADSPYLTGLTRLDLRGNSIGEPGRSQLRALFGPGVRF